MNSKQPIWNWMKISVIYLLEDTNIKVSGQKLLMQEFGSIINNCFWGCLYIEHYSKLSVLARLPSYMTLTQRRIPMKFFIEAQFGYCLLVFMFHGRVLNRKINQLHQRSLRIVWKGIINKFHEFLQKDHSFTIYHRNIQSLAIEL